MEASAGLHSAPEAVSEAPKSLLPFTASEASSEEWRLQQKDSLKPRGSLAHLSPLNFFFLPRQRPSGHRRMCALAPPFNVSIVSNALHRGAD